MVTPLPSVATVNLEPPGADEVELIARGMRSASRPLHQDDSLQLLVLQALTKAMTGFEVDYAGLAPIEPDEFAAGLAARDEGFRTRMVQGMELGHLVLAEPDVAVADRVIEFAHELGVDNDCIHKARAVADGSHQLVAADFDRNEYVSGLDASVLPWRPDGAPADASAAWSTTTVDQELAGRWRALGELPPDAIGRRVHEFYVGARVRLPG